MKSENFLAREKKIEAHTKVSIAAYDQGVVNGKKEMLDQVIKDVDNFENKLVQYCDFVIDETEEAEVDKHYARGIADLEKVSLMGIEELKQKLEAYKKELQDGR